VLPPIIIENKPIKDRNITLRPETEAQAEAEAERESKLEAEAAAKT
jgi:hypothetical protein